LANGLEIQPPKPKYPTLNPLSQAPFFTLSALTELLLLSPDPKIKQKSARCDPIPSLLRPAGHVPKTGVVKPRAAFAESVNR
jgi:hypothetical protein